MIAYTGGSNSSSVTTEMTRTNMRRLAFNLGSTSDIIGPLPTRSILQVVSRRADAKC